MCRRLFPRCHVSSSNAQEVSGERSSVNGFEFIVVYDTF